MDDSLEWTELSTQILVLKVLIAAAWADGEMDDRERKLLEHVILRTRLSETRKAMLQLSIEDRPSEGETDAVLAELCQRAGTQEVKSAIIALVDRMITSDDRTQVAELEFRERLEATMKDKGKRFFSAIADRFRTGDSAE